ncbi:MAG: META domain-containing protein [Candidatus Pacebacteria bacterium]|nr:META domain-containing protein [Candidatus Paceibacterota bacterium]
MKKTLITGGLIGIALVGGFFLLNNYIYQEKQADTENASLTTQTWTWVAALYNDGREIVPQDPQAFTLSFGTDGSFTATTDCNQMNGSYTTEGDKITFGTIGMTKMFCEGSQEATFSQLLTDTQTYHIADGELIFDLKFDSGSVMFR